MLIKFTDSYNVDIQRGYRLVADIQSKISKKEMFMGNDKALDRLYAQSVLILAIIEVLENDDNANPMSNETFLQELKFLITLNY